MSGKTSKSNNILTEFYKCKQEMDLDSTTADKIVVSDKLKKFINTLLVIKKMKSSSHYVIRNKLSIKFNSEPIYENKYLKAKVREFDSDIKTNFSGNGLSICIIFAVLA